MLNDEIFSVIFKHRVNVQEARMVMSATAGISYQVRQLFCGLERALNPGQTLTFWQLSCIPWLWAWWSGCGWQPTTWWIVVKCKQIPNAIAMLGDVINSRHWMMIDAGDNCTAANVQSSKLKSQLTLPGLLELLPKRSHQPTNLHHRHFKCNELELIHH